MNDFTGKKQPGQIVYQSYTSGDVWDRLEQKSRQTRRKVALRCPKCSGEIHLTKTRLLRCSGCQTPIEVFQRRYPTLNRDTHRIYIHSNGIETEIRRIVMQCLSCEKRLTEDGGCSTSCGIQTYLILVPEDSEIYVKRWVNHFNVPREPMEIPIRQTIRQTTTGEISRDKQTLKTQPNATQERQPATAASGNVILEESHDLTHQEPDFQAATQGLPTSEKILIYLHEHKQATTAEMRQACKCYPETFNKAIKQLIRTNYVEKVKRGVYRLIRPLTH